MASQLLNEHVSLSNYDHHKEPPTPLRGSAEVSLPAFTWFGDPGLKFWVVSAALIYILAILLAWVSKGGERKNNFSKSRTGIALLLLMIVGMFLFVYARR